MGVMMVQINKLYGILTNGCQDGRKTNVTRLNISDYISDIVETLIPANLPNDEKMFRAEFLIKLASTDLECFNLLKDNDPYNSYEVAAYNYVVHNWDIQETGEQIKQLMLEGSERSFGYIEHLINALYIIIKYLGK
jgi:hypothetical protein